MRSIIDGRRWRDARIKFLENLLSGDPPPEQRVLIESELEDLHREARIHRRGPLRWLHLPRHPPDL